ncbi:unnamed protein product [Moneuplotes crassus]|uniref:Uncharacterized protein n=1 Tax=Euplotes crassus TaxID=5936 RepID=A0AAD1XSS1_EUPCR|nr:unnamed protein product [Moneuplotes crassus]
MEFRDGREEMEVRKKECKVRDEVVKGACCGFGLGKIPEDVYFIRYQEMYNFQLLLLRKIQSLKLSSIPSVTTIDNKNKEGLLKTPNAFFPKSITDLFIHCSHGNFRKKDINKGSYNKRIAISLIPRVMKRFTLVCFKLSQNQFRKIIQVGRHLDKIELRVGVLALNGLKLSKSLHYCIKAIHFDFRVQDRLPFKLENNGSLKDFIKAASETDLKDSLEELEFQGGVSKDMLVGYAKDLGFQNISPRDPYTDYIILTLIRQTIL